MNEIIKGIKDRRSCRNYESRQIDDYELKDILDCGLLAPSGMNQQGIKFTVVQNKATLVSLKELVGRDFIYGAPTLIIVHADKAYKYAHVDGSAAIENMYIAANALGLGACWINQLKDHEGSEALNKLDLVQEVIVGCLALGYPAKQPEDRKLNKDRIVFIK